MNPEGVRGDLDAGVTVHLRGWRRWRDRLLLDEDLNFLLTNRVPRIALTRLMGRVSRIRSERFTRLGIAVWRLFTDLDLSEAAEPQRWNSLRDCFTRALKPGARPVDTDPRVLVSPCDGIVGACGGVRAGQVWQAKGFPYRAAELFGDEVAASAFEGGVFVTLRLTSAMYHRFHAPDAARIERVMHLAGDTWNVNPIALARIERLFCRNQRAVLHLRLAEGAPLALVPVAAILVASLRLHCLDDTLTLAMPGRASIPCNTPVQRGEELGWFEQGSTVIVFAPPGCALAPGVDTGVTLRMGRPLLVRC